MKRVIAGVCGAFLWSGCALAEPVELKVWELGGQARQVAEYVCDPSPGKEWPVSFGKMTNGRLERVQIIIARDKNGNFLLRGSLDNGVERRVTGLPAVLSLGERNGGLLVITAWPRK